MITELHLQHFRNYANATFGFAPGVNCIVGPNASGKTNLLEAVLMIARGVSYRGSETGVVQHGAEWARLDAQTPSRTRILKLKMQPTLQKTFELDGQVLTRLHPSRMLPVVLFEPNHLLLLSGAPEVRRTFLDDLIEQTQPGYGAVRRHYRRVLAQRNNLLKKNPPDLSQQLFVWNVRLSELGGQIARRRQELVERFNEKVPEFYQQLAEANNRLELHYASRFPSHSYESHLLHKLEDSLELDTMRGFTAYGPHRDDLRVFMDGHPLQETASRGEIRTLVLALKIVELQLVEVAYGAREPHAAKPLLLLDDVFSELDNSRRAALTNHVQAYQTFITTTDAEGLSAYFDNNHQIVLKPDANRQS